MAILDTMSDLGKTVAQKSSDIAELGKLTLNIKKKEHEIKNIHSQIGQYVFEQYLKGDVFDDVISTYCAEINTALQEINNFKEDKENIGVNHLDVEVVATEVPDTDSDFAITPEDEEMLKDL